ncbi:MAG: COX15/CtaA family protein, partial [Acidimicrobiales bacterium]
MRRLSISPTGYRRLCGLALAAQIAIIVSGGAVRLTGSGLGCSDWPTCEEDRLVAPAEYHALIEFLNRAVGTGFVSLTIAAVVVGALLRSPRRPDLLRWSLALVAGVIAQIVLGGLVVLAHLDPRLTGGHFLVSIVMVWAAVVLHHRASLPERADRTHRAGGKAGRRPTRRTLLLSRFAVAAGAVVVVAGAVVTGSGPHGGDTRAERLPYDIGQAARVHSLSAWVLVALSAALAAAAARG